MNDSVAEQDRLSLEAARVSSGALARVILFAFAVTLPLDVVEIADLGSITFFGGIVLAGAGVWHIVSTGTLRSVPSSILMLTCYTAWALASVLWAHDTKLALDRWMTNIQLLAFLWLGWQISRTRRDIALMTSGFVAGCVVACAGAWQSFAAGSRYAEERSRYAAARYTGMGYDPNDMGLTVALAIPLAAYLAMSRSGRRSWLWLCYLPVAISAVGLSGSRGAMMATAAALLVVLLWVGRRSRVAIGFMLVCVAAAVVLVAVYSPETFDRFFTIRQQLASGTYSDRRNIWAAWFRTFLQHPIVGLGTGQFARGVAPELGYSIEAHNAFLSVLTELGLVGLVLFAGAFVVVVRQAWTSARNERWLVLGLLATWFVGVSSLTWEMRKTTWFIVLIGAAVGQLSRADAEDAREAASASSSS